MALLLGSQIIKNVKNGSIVVEPFIEENVGPNSIDITLANKLLTYVECKIHTDKNGTNYVEKVIQPMGDNFIDMAEDNKVYELEIPKNGLVLAPGILYLGSTNEKAGSDYFIPMYEGRSSMARLGIQSHISAGFGDIFFKSNWTLEITVVHPTKIYPNIRIGQVYFHEVCKTSRTELIELNKHYQGKYTDQTEAQKSKSYLDFK